MWPFSPHEILLIRVMVWSSIAGSIAGLIMLAVN
jgi:hypothetical protein